ncbi:MAG: hypothetical protein IJI24_02070 [Lachnospiraceae bacterium]|nr:hypothetical protein [Lachnospiraceae bacterium]
MTNTKNPDWRAPLYTCALTHSKTERVQDLVLALKEFSLLGDYQDAPAQKNSCRDKLEEIHQKTVDTIARTGDLRTLIKEIARLKHLAGVFDCAAQISEAQQKKQRLYRAGVWKRRICRLLLAGAVLAGLACIVYVNVMR